MARKKNAAENTEAVSANDAAIQASEDARLAAVKQAAYDLNELLGLNPPLHLGQNVGALEQSIIEEVIQPGLLTNEDTFSPSTTTVLESLGWTSKQAPDPAPADEGQEGPTEEELAVAEVGASAPAGKRGGKKAEGAKVKKEKKEKKEKKGKKEKKEEKATDGTTRRPRDQSYKQAEMTRLLKEGGSVSKIVEELAEAAPKYGVLPCSASRLRAYAKKLVKNHGGNLELSKENDYIRYTPAPAASAA